MKAKKPPRPLPYDMEMRIAKGLCSTCTRPQAPGQKKNRRPLCGLHLKKRRARTARRSREAIEKGRCYRCGEPATGGKKWPICEAHRAERAASVARLRRRRWSKDRCTRCDAEMEPERAAKRFVLCASCQKKQTKQNAKRPATTRRCQRVITERRIKAQVCVRCGDPWKGPPTCCKECRRVQRLKDQERRREKRERSEASGSDEGSAAKGPNRPPADTSPTRPA